jgi:hypothetical protein
MLLLILVSPIEELVTGEITSLGVLREMSVLLAARVFLWVRGHPKVLLRPGPLLIGK